MISVRSGFARTFGARTIWPNHAYLPNTRQRARTAAPSLEVSGSSPAPPTYESPASGAFPVQKDNIPRRLSAKCLQRAWGLAAAAALGSELIDLPERIIGSRSLGRRIGSASEQQLNRPNVPASCLRLKEFDELGLAQRRCHYRCRPIGLKCKTGER
jgi:hypothetical protein